jgi:hypothetical protein
VTDGPLGLDVDYPRALLYALVVAVLVGTLVAASTSATAFGAYNARWDGASELRAEADATGAETTLLRNASRYNAIPANGTVALVLSPDRAYSAADRARLRLFVRDGGTLVVAEDVGPHGNDLLRDVGATARFDGTLLRDERHNYRSPGRPIARNTAENETLTEGVDKLTLNRGTVVDPGNATVLVRSSGFAYLDANNNSQPDDEETLQEWPVATVEGVGEGRVVAVSDPSLFINAMLDRPDNRQFARNLFAPGDRVVLDYSHTAGVPPLQGALLTARNSPLLQFGAGLVALALVGALGRGVVGRLTDRTGRRRSAAPAGASADDLAAYLRERHPEWDDERVRRVVRTARPDGAVDEREGETGGD